MVIMALLENSEDIKLAAWAASKYRAGISRYHILLHRLAGVGEHREGNHLDHHINEALEKIPIIILSQLVHHHIMHFIPVLCITNTRFLRSSEGLGCCTMDRYHCLGTNVCTPPRLPMFDVASDVACTN
jgi:hypothetical protein